MDNSVSILSLIVAVAAVIVGPMISLRIANRQIRSSLRIANKQIVAPMRQSWIASLRDLIAELTSTAMLYYLAGFEERTEDEYRRLIRLEYQVQLMLNPREEDHERLEALIGQMTDGLKRGTEGDRKFLDAHPKILELSRQVFKREWNRVRDNL